MADKVQDMEMLTNVESRCDYEIFGAEKIYELKLGELNGCQR